MAVATESMRGKEEPTTLPMPELKKNWTPEGQGGRRRSEHQSRQAELLCRPNLCQIASSPRHGTPSNKAAPRCNQILPLICATN